MRRAAVTAFLLSVLAVASAPAAPYLAHKDLYIQENPREGFAISQFIRNYVPLDQELNFEKLEAQLKSENGPKTIAALVETLPKSMTDLNYILMYRSRSLQGASPEAPRVITYAPSGRFILTFNGGDTKVRGANSIEIIQYREKTRRFEFREISFDEAGLTPPKISVADPAKCVACHQSPARIGVDMRPNWEPYNIWPGAVGSLDGFESTPERYRARFTLPDDQPLKADALAEKSYLKRFFAVAKTHPRYKHLGAFDLRGPTVLSDLLTTHNFARIARLMKAEGAIVERFPSLWFRLAVCDAGYKRNGPIRLLSPMRAQFQKNRDNDPDQADFSEFLTRLYESFGVDTADWSLDFRTGGRLAFGNRFDSPNVALLTFMQAVRNEFGNVSWSYECTSEVIRSSDAELASKLGDVKVKAEMKSPDQNQGDFKAAAIRSCMRCHDTFSAIAPGIPFDDETALKQALKKRAKSGQVLVDDILSRTRDLAPIETQMPPGRKLDPDSARALRVYIRSLK